MLDLPTHHLRAHSLTLTFQIRKPIYYSSESAQTVASTWFRPSEGRILSIGHLEGTELQMFNMSSEGGRTRLGQRSPLRLEAQITPKAPWLRCSPSCPRLRIALHTDAGPVVHQRLSTSSTRSAAQVPPETTAEHLHLVVRIVHS